MWVPAVVASSGAMARNARSLKIPANWRICSTSVSAVGSALRSGTTVKMTSATAAVIAASARNSMRQPNMRVANSLGAVAVKRPSAPNDITQAL